MSRKRKILAITGIRSEYGILSAVFRAITKRPELELQVLATGAHLANSYGYTVDEIEADGFKIADRIESLLDADSGSAKVKSMAISLQGMVQTVQRVKPDLLLVLGDREEAIAAGILAQYMNIPLAHLCGGDRVMGDVDDQIRHATTKMAHLHFPTNRESYERILKLGEEPARVFNHGHPGLDCFRQTPALPEKMFSKKTGIPLNGDRFILLLQHPLSSEFEHSYRHMKITLEAIKKLKIKTVVAHPNSDPGSKQIIKAISEYQHLPFVHAGVNFTHQEFIHLLRKASCLAGNSSAGILEAPFIKLPVVNIGNRQKGRLHAENVEFVRHDVNAICSALERALFDKSYRKKVANCSNPYGDGKASEKIAQTLATIPLDNKLLVKNITY